MAFDAFIKIKDIDGESTDENHQGWIELLSYNHGVAQQVSGTASSAGGASAERANFNDFGITKQLDIASPALTLACADGTHIDEIVVELCRAGTDKVKFMEYKLTNCLISSVNVSGGTGGDLPTESVAINYGKITWSYAKQDRKGGKIAGNMAAGWDLQKNCKC
ncbi:MAG: type VI secretion system tube protein Hcp [Desulfatitalea sp.]|nr:type VI secretion system tube protein Hcp [Desulfatitalea sp.]